MKTKQRTLDPFEKWMVRSNLETIRAQNNASEIVAILRAGGYLRVAAAVERALQKEQA